MFFLCQNVEETQIQVCAQLQYLRKENYCAMSNADFSCGRNTFFFGSRLQAQPTKIGGKGWFRQGLLSVWALADCEWRAAAPGLKSACRAPGRRFDSTKNWELNSTWIWVHVEWPSITDTKVLVQVIKGIKIMSVWHTLCMHECDYKCTIHLPQCWVICVIWLISVCDVTRSCMCVTWVIPVCDECTRIHLRVWNDLGLRVCCTKVVAQE